MHLTKIMCLTAKAVKLNNIFYSIHSIVYIVYIVQMFIYQKGNKYIYITNIFIIIIIIHYNTF